MRAKEIVNESKILRTEQGPIYENPNKRTILNLIYQGEGIRGISIYGEYWVANAYDMIHADIAVNTGLSMDYSTPENADLFMLTPRGQNKFEVDLFGPDFTYDDLPRPVKQAVEEIRKHGYRIQVIVDDHVVQLMDPITNETATAGATGAGAVATVNQPALAVQRRTGPYMNHTVVGPDGKPIKQLGSKKKKKKKKNLNEGKLYKVKDEPVIEKPTNAQLENLANKSKWNSIRITQNNNGRLFAWPADKLTHNDVEDYMETYIDEDFEAEKEYNFTLIKGSDGVVWRAFADNGIADANSLDKLMSIKANERAIGQVDFDPNAEQEFWAPRWGM